MKKIFFIFPALILPCCFLTHAQTYFKEDFEQNTGSALPKGWSQATKASDGGWLRGYGSALTSYSFAPSLHTYILATNDSKCQCDKKNDFVKTPSINLSNAHHPWLAFDYFTNTIYQDDSLKISGDGGITWATIWVDTTVDYFKEDYLWHTLELDLSKYAGLSSVKIGFKFSDKGITSFGWAIDNVKLFERRQHDIDLIEVTPASFAENSFATVGGSLKMGGVIFNAGFDTITDFSVFYSDEVIVHSCFFSSVHINPFDSLPFVDPIPYVVQSLGAHPLKIWVSINGDTNLDNDSLTTLVTGVTRFPNHKMVVEEATGTWCGYCVSGIVFMDSMNHVDPINIIPIAVHDGDPMEVSDYNSGESSFPGFIGFPSIVMNRIDIGDPDTIFDFNYKHLPDFGYADVNMTTDYNSSTRLVTINAVINPIVDLIGDYRIAFVFIEDSVRGISSGYDQTNFYSAGDSLHLGPMGGFENLPDPVPHQLMVYHDVARSISGGYFGEAGSLPDTMHSGISYNRSLSYVIPDSYNPHFMKAIVLLMDGAKNQILNANAANLDVTTSVANNFIQSSISLYPNPATENCMINISLENASHVSITCINMMGEQVKEIFNAELKSGKNSVAFKTISLPAGMYQIQIRSDLFMETKTLLVLH